MNKKVKIKIDNSKKDKQFMIQFDQTNRDHLMNMAMFMLSMLVSVSAIMVAIYSLIHSIAGFNLYSITVAVVFLLILVPFWISIFPYAKRAINNSKKLNKQLQKELFEVYPEYKEKYH